VGGDLGSRIGELFLESYLETTRGASFIPADGEALQILLEASLLEKAAYELAYEINNRPDWAAIAARGIRSLLKAGLAAPCRRQR
jgi:predicted trehalose synthase